MTLIPEDWIKSINKSKNYWENQAEKMQQYHARFSNTFTKVNNQFNHSRGAHTLQMMFVCEIDDDGTITRYNQYGYDGVNFISFDLKTQTWTAATPQAENFTPTLKSTEYWMNYTEDVCLDLLKTFVLYAKGEEKRNGRPQASVFQKHSPPPAVGNEEVLETVELRETLPNHDGTFQKRSILKVSAEDLQKHSYTCVIQHSSLEKEMVLEVPKGYGSGGGWIGIILFAVGLAAVFCVIFVWKIMNSSERRTDEGRKAQESDDPGKSILDNVVVEVRNGNRSLLLKFKA